MNNQSAKQEDVSKAFEFVQKITSEIEKNIVGQKMLTSRLIFALLSGGHILLEGVPGLAKTRAINVLSKSINGSFNRIQFTPDLLPSDIIGNLVFNPKDAIYDTKKGPIFANFILADEINRAPAKVQSALLEAMQEYQVTIGDKSYKLPKPFFVLATQNPIEHEGTYPLPEAQIDRFLLKSVITYPTPEEEMQILSLIENESELNVKAVASIEEVLAAQEIVNKVYVDPKIREYIVNIVNATRNPESYGLKGYTSIIEFGASPRASIAFLKVAKIVALLNNRNYVIPEDIKEIRYDVLRHRTILTYEAEADGQTSEKIIDDIFSKVIVP